MYERYAAGRDVEHWRLIHDRLNGLVPMQAPPQIAPLSDEDMKLREHIAKHGCCS